MDEQEFEREHDDVDVHAPNADERHAEHWHKDMDRMAVAREQKLYAEVYAFLQANGQAALALKHENARWTVYDELIHRGIWAGIVERPKKELPNAPESKGLFEWELEPDAQYEIHTLHGTFKRILDDARDARLLNDETDYERGAA